MASLSECLIVVYQLLTMIFLFGTCLGVVHAWKTSFQFRNGIHLISLTRHFSHLRWSLAVASTALWTAILSITLMGPSVGFGLGLLASPISCAFTMQVPGKQKSLQLLQD
jgi:LytS/YehU family sensor histidine kinase